MAEEETEPSCDSLSTLSTNCNLPGRDSILREFFQQLDGVGSHLAHRNVVIEGENLGFSTIARPIDIANEFVESRNVHRHRVSHPSVIEKASLPVFGLISHDGEKFHGQC